MRENRLKNIARKVNFLEANQTFKKDQKDREYKKENVVKKITFRMTQKEYRKLQIEAVNKGTSVSTLCRMILKESLGI